MVTYHGLRRGVHSCAALWRIVHGGARIVAIPDEIPRYVTQHAPVEWGLS
jgi:hypothetical protein